MAKTPKKTFAQGELDPMLMRVRIVAPQGARRRAGISFTSVPRELTFADLGDDVEAAQETLKILMADPHLSVSPVIEEGSIEPKDEEPAA
ncbi:MAG: hypothetical protein M9955_15655 [Rhizobiaceae bacterium]|nr:hypothetical protein [Rhizobiaceae bacterium]